MSLLNPEETKSARIRKELGHPVIAGDGHVIELVPVFADFVRDHGRDDLVELAPTFAMGGESRRTRRELPPDERRRRGVLPGFWLAPGDTDYWLTVATPSLYYERLDEAGIDFSVLYPSIGIPIALLADDDQRITLCQLYNEFMAEQYRPYHDRLTVAAVVPMYTPQEAVAGMEHAVGMEAKVVLIANWVLRPLPGGAGESADYRGSAGGWLGSYRTDFVDTYGIDSVYDYDPVWAKAIELGLPLGCHRGAQGFSDRSSISNYMYNHIGHFAASGEALAKSLFFGGVTRRFPRLRIALLEGGVAAGVRLYADLASHWQKRGGHAIGRLNPANLDRDRIASVLAERDPRLARYSTDELLSAWGSPEDGRDDFAESGVQSLEEIRDQFCTNFYWGCEADDPMVGLAFDPKFTPLGARVPAIMGSDIGHWDVTKFDAPVAEAYELMERGILDIEALRDFLFINPARCYASLNPDFFTGTAIEKDAAALSKSSLGPAG